MLFHLKRHVLWILKSMPEKGEEKTNEIENRFSQLIFLNCLSFLKCFIALMVDWNGRDGVIQISETDSDRKLLYAKRIQHGGSEVLRDTKTSRNSANWQNTESLPLELLWIVSQAICIISLHCVFIDHQSLNWILVKNIIRLYRCTLYRQNLIKKQTKSIYELTSNDRYEFFK